MSGCNRVRSSDRANNFGKLTVSVWFEVVVEPGAEFVFPVLVIGDERLSVSLIQLPAKSNVRLCLFNKSVPMRALGLMIGNTCA